MNGYAQTTRHCLRTGFTLIEILLVLLILGLLAGVGLPLVMNQIESSRTNTTKISLKATAQALDLYKLQIGSYPKRLDDLVEKPKGPDGSKWVSPYMDKLPKDGWGQEFYYKLTPNAKKSYELYSYGKGGADGVAEDRISVWDV